MALAPAADQVRLLDVQELDTKADQLRHKRSGLPAAQRLEELTAEFAQAHATQAGLKANVDDIGREVRKAEADVEQVRTREDRNQKRLDVGQGSAKDLQGMQAEMESLGRRRSELEDLQLAVMERQEEAENQLREAESRIEAITSERDQVAAALEAELAELNGELARLEADRAGIVEELDAGLITLYERLRSQRGGIGAAALRARRCEGCRLELNPNDLAEIAAAPVDQIVRCEECGRILVRVPDSGL